MSAMPSPDKNEPSKITGSRVVGGNYTRHEQREFTCSAVQYGRQKYGLFCKTRPPVSFVMSKFQKQSQNALKIINQNCEELNLTDIWRTLNAGKHRYTWRRKKPEIQCRLDFFLISSDLICNINLADIVHQSIPVVPIPPPRATAGHLLTLSVPGAGH